MEPLSAELELLGVALAGIGGVALGLAALLAGPGGPGRRRLALLVLVALAGAVTASALLRLPGRMTAALAGLAGLWALGLLLRTPHPGRLALAALRRLASPRLQALLLIAAGLGAVLGEAWAADESLGAALQESEGLAALVSKPALKPLPVSARTDRRAPITLCAVADLKDYHGNPETEERAVREGPMALRVIRTAIPSPESNCHGWVFTGGRFWVKGEEVDRILADNGYVPVASPRAEDIVIYRDDNGMVLHTARVEAVTRNGLVLVEGKWGQFGRFLHAPEDQPYSRNWAWYRSPRDGHLLRGLDEPPSTGPARPTT